MLVVHTQELRLSAPPAADALRLPGDPLFNPGGCYAGPHDCLPGRWTEHVDGYRALLRASYRAHREAWDTLLARPGVTILCHCQRADRCNRQLLAEVLAQLGARCAGELPPPPLPPYKLVPSEEERERRAQAMS